jgi:hypothetical protein
VQVRSERMWLLIKPNVLSTPATGSGLFYIQPNPSGFPLRPIGGIMPN